LNDKGDLFSIERLGQLLRETSAAEPLEMVRLITDAVDAFTGASPRTDDVTALALRWRPAATAAERPMLWPDA
jgi:serine phosphatase RsbU (regulator of sigma subunit)